jgi:hypothetical protein
LRRSGGKVRSGMPAVWTKRWMAATKALLMGSMRAEEATG